jgi:hypothetical protein
MNTQIPNRLDHIRIIAANAQRIRQQTEPNLINYEGELTLLGACFNSLYQAATCHRKCWGGNHVLESLAARSYNLGCASYTLICTGLYDEALNLVRGLGEMSNLIMLGVMEPGKIQEWVNADKATRLREFSPAKVRRLLGDKVVMDATWYGNLCESFTHVTPQTKPNHHTEGLNGHCGGMFQEQGLESSLEQLLNTLGPISMMICKYFKYDDLFDEISELIDA